MNYDIWFKKIIALLQIGGSYIGIVVLLTFLTGPDSNIWTSFLMIVILVPLILLGFYAGILLLEKKELGTKLSILNQLIQTPVISMPYFMFGFSSGFNVTTSIIGVNYSLKYNIGTFIDFAFF